MSFTTTTPTGGAPLGTDGSADGHKARTLILCFDGTANQYDGDNTNVVKFYSLLKKNDESDEQLCYYQPGIGTYLNPGVVSPVFQWCAKILDEAFAWYLDEHVRGGYQFLMQNYVAGDKICIFGFSRGAYTARALAGMLHKIGLLPRDNPEQLPFAYKLFKQTDDDSITLAAGFKQTFCRDVKIEFVGVWETVVSVGVIMGRTLPFTTANTTIKTFRHALSLDEHRVKFLPNLYHTTSTPQDVNLRRANTSKRSNSKRKSRHISYPKAKAAKAVNEATKTSGHTSVERPIAGQRQRSLGTFFRRWSSKAPRLNPATMPPPQVRQGQQSHTVDLEAATGAASGSEDAHASSASSDEIAGGTDVLEVWFAGCHSDVGGGAVSDATTVSLADVTLRWMVREVVRAQCGVAFDPAALVRANIPDTIFTGTGMAIPPRTTITPIPRSLQPGSEPSARVAAETPGPGTSAQTTADPGAADPSSGSGDGDDNGDPLDTGADALAPINDELQIDKLWWLLEVIPLTYQVQDTDGKWKTKWWIHLGRGRQLPDAPKFHVSVKERMSDPSLAYVPRAKWPAGTETYVE